VTVRELAEGAWGETCGDAEVCISAARNLSDARPGDITLVSEDHERTEWDTSTAAAAVVSLDFVWIDGRPVIRVAEPAIVFAQFQRQFLPRLTNLPETTDPTAHIHPTAMFGDGVTAGPFAVVGADVVVGANTILHAGVIVGRDCRIGADTVLHPQVVVYDNCVIGDRVVIHANAVIGADGFGYRFQGGKHVKVPQLGWVEIDDDVEVGAGSTIDRGTFGPTRVGAGSKIHNLVMVAHNCQIGDHNLLAGQVGLAGSTSTGEHVQMADQSGVIDHKQIGDRAIVRHQSAVLRDVPADARVIGYPAKNEDAVKAVTDALDELPEVRKDVRRIKKHLGPDMV
jgi:UDP-3-O-[3-hydroxymyristoyl] glucosamine N-acyltransferase